MVALDPDHARRSPRTCTRACRGPDRVADVHGHGRDRMGRRSLCQLRSRLDLGIRRWRMNPVTMGGAMVGLCIVLHRLVTWWPGLKGIAGRGVRCLSSLLPFVFAYAVGALFIMCAGGLIGYAADWTLWGTNWLGDTALVWGVGGTGDQDVTRRGPQQALTNGGHMVTVLLLVGLLAARKKSGSQDLGTGLL